MIRLRQVALVAARLDTTVQSLCDAFDLDICHRDPGVGEFGLHNALMVVGDQFLEVVSPTTDGTTAGRLLDKRDGDGGYMVIHEVDDLDRRVDRMGEHDVRVVWAGDFSTIRGWMFDSEGGFGVGVWSQDGNRWTVQALLVLPDGKRGSVTTVMEVVDDNTMNVFTVGREVDGELLPNVGPIEVVRK